MDSDKRTITEADISGKKFYFTILIYNRDASCISKNERAKTLYYHSFH